VFARALSVGEQGPPLAVQVGLERTDAPPLCLQAWLQSNRRRAWQQVIDRPGQGMRQESQGLSLAVFLLYAGEKLLRGRISPQE